MATCCICALLEHTLLSRPLAAAAQQHGAAVRAWEGLQEATLICSPGGGCQACTSALVDASTRRTSPLVTWSSWSATVFPQHSVCAVHTIKPVGGQPGQAAGLLWPSFIWYPENIRLLLFSHHNPSKPLSPLSLHTMGSSALSVPSSVLVASQDAVQGMCMHTPAPSPRS